MNRNGSGGNFDLIVARRGTVALGAPTIELANVLWPEAVEGPALLNSVSQSYASHMALPPGAADALALWVAHAHCVDAFLHSPRLNFSSPEEGCGKTVGLDITSCLAPRSLCTECPTEAALCRAVHNFQPTLILDEYDNWLKADKKLLSVLNAGHKLGAVRLRSRGAGQDLQLYNIFSAVALGGIGALPRTLEDRSIVIRLARALPGEIKQPFDARFAEREIALRQKLGRWAFDHHLQIRQCKPKLPDGASNRRADNWRPLFAVAEIAGGDWSSRANRSFALLSGANPDMQRSPGPALLAGIREIFRDRQAFKMASADLAAGLNSLEGHLWSMRGDGPVGLSAHQVAFLLRPYGITPRTIRLGAGTVKGYHLSDFTEAFQRFLAPIAKLES